MTKSTSSAAAEGLPESKATDPVDDIGIDIDNLRNLLDVTIGLAMDITRTDENRQEMDRVLSLLIIGRDIARNSFVDLANLPAIK